MSDRSAGRAPARVIAVLGPTNTGKTHYAVERMLGHASGMIGLPLRLLAREIYDRIVKLRGARAVALITGEEKIVPPRATYFVCTVEAMPLGREVEFLAIDEAQLCADPARGHVFTDRILHARGTAETLLLGALTAGPLLRRLLPEVEFVTRERFSALTYAGSKKLTRLPRRTAVVAFSAQNVYAIAELIRRQRGGAAVVMGSLSPRTRNAQVALYQSGEVDFLVATDAIGMGLNMDVDHVAFAGLRKFDGKKTRWLNPQEVGQIAGRAGRYTRDGTFGVTGEAPEMDDELIEAIQEHRFQPLAAAEWRNARLDFGSLPALLSSLAKPPRQDGLKLAAEAVDELTLRKLAEDDEVVALAKGHGRLQRLWEVCQTPDFRKTTLDEHLRLTRSIFLHLVTPRGRLPEDWVDDQFRALDSTAGEIDVLAQRLASIRTLAYAANRPDWLADPAHWQARTRALEDRISDTLHERLMQRFIDRRTSALLRGLNLREDVLAGVGHDGAVTVEGHDVGRLVGVTFEVAKGGSALEDKALRGAALKAVTPLVARRLGELAASPDQAFALDPDGVVRWNDDPAGRLAGGDPFAPKVKLFGAFGPETARERARRRLDAFVAARSSTVLAALKALNDAMASGALKGLSRGIAYRLAEAGGVLDRGAVAGEVAALSQGERRALRSLGVRFGAFSLYLPALLAPEARAHLEAFARLEAADARPDPAAVVTAPPLPPRVAAAYGLRQVGGYRLPVEALERLDALLREHPAERGASRLPADAAARLDWPLGAAEKVLRALDYARVARAADGQGELWRRRARNASEAAPAEVPRPRPASPFAALGDLAVAPPPPQKPPRPAGPAAAAPAVPTRPGPPDERGARDLPRRPLAMARSLLQDARPRLPLHRGRPPPPDARRPRNAPGQALPHPATGRRPRLRSRRPAGGGAGGGRRRAARPGQRGAPALQCARGRRRRRA